MPHQEQLLQTEMKNALYSLIGAACDKVDPIAISRRRITSDTADLPMKRDTDAKWGGLNLSCGSHEITAELQAALHLNHSSEH